MTVLSWTVDVAVGRSGYPPCLGPDPPNRGGMAWTAARNGGDCVNGAVQVFDMRERRRSDPDDRPASAEHIGEFTVGTVVLITEFR